ncbi:MAG: hypothetical protein FJ218_10610, partial [Ignavibacteria bacterium]|nr:hypothetical protein [Ignavibacteria bacterium]
EELVPPLEKIFEHTTVAGFPKDAGTLVDSFLFVGTFNGEVKVYNITNGTSYGYFDAGVAVSGAPTVDGFRIFIPLVKDQNSLVAYDLQDKHIDWKINIGNIESSPLVFQENIFVVTTDSKLYSLKKRTGEINWTFEEKTKKSGSRAHCSVVSDGFNLYFGNDEGIVYSVGIDSGKQQWKFDAEGSIFSSPTIFENKIYFTTTKGNVYVLSLDGTLQWKKNMDVPLYATVGIGQHSLLVATSDGKIVSLNRINGETEWEFQTKSVINVTPLVLGNFVYVGTTDKNLYALNISDGSVAWNYPLEGRVKTNLLARKNYLVAFVEDRTILIFKGRESKIF